MYKTLIITDNDQLTTLLQNSNDHLKALPEIISFSKYLTDYPKKNEPKTRIINLCDTSLYLSKGYYCSLLAEAREHQVLPSVRTINELRDFSHDDGITRLLLKEMDKLDSLSAEFETLIYFGNTEDEKLRRIGGILFKEYPSPVLRLTIKKDNGQLTCSLARVALNELNKAEQHTFGEQLHYFTKNVWRVKRSKKKFRWEMAILTNPKEQDPPSNKEAISRFVKAASKFGIQADVISHDKIQNIAYYDALFIRETTAIDHHTFRIASKAERAGLITIDDPTSILRCCNKVFLQDAFTYHGVPAPKTVVLETIDDATIEMLESEFSYPMVLKMPEGSFSRGVHKVSDRESLIKYLHQLKQESALVLVQEYMYTEFDWRIGILNGHAIYASKYMMARNHWQIYNHGSKRFNSGDFMTLPTFEVPKVVLNAALKSAAIIGNGLYGVDVKHNDGKAYVLEVNDNPSIDHKVEDAYLGDELYMLIMSEFQRRLEIRGR